MKKFLRFLLVVAVVALSACEQPFVTEDISEEIALKSAQMTMNFRAHLSSDQEVPPVASMATGEAVFRLSKDGMMLKYTLIVANIEQVRMAHIHLAQAGQNGGVVAWLYPSGPPPVVIDGKTNGVLAKGELKAENLVGSLAGMSLMDLLDAMKAGNAYVNVHTDGYPGGEIRGQISAN